MAKDLDVQIAEDLWKKGDWTCWDVCECIALQWGDKHVDDADGDKSNYNAHSPEDVAVFTKAALACMADVAKWAALIKAVLP